jgi:hypothetical protein
MDHGIVLKAKTEGLFSFETFIANVLAFHLDQALSGIVRASGWCEKTPAPIRAARHLSFRARRPVRYLICGTI